jgi:hypothetical protein
MCCGFVENSQATLLYNTFCLRCISENTATHSDHQRSMLSHVTLKLLISMEVGLCGSALRREEVDDGLHRIYLPPILTT